MLFIHYDSLIANPKIELSKITEFLDLSPHNYQFKNIINVTEEKDASVWGLEDLHTINPRLEKTCKDPKEILGSILFDYYSNLEKQYSF